MSRREDHIALGLLLLLGVGVCAAIALMRYLDVIADRLVRP